MDNALSQKAEDTLNQFAAVKKAEVNFQTSLGNRKGQLGINLIGAFAERQNNAFGWQVRVYGAQQDGKGFNAGVFYRHITDNVLIGANAFVDYENHKLGNFYRYSIGGEAQNRYGSFAANYYVPITDEKRKDGGVIFSRKGYDAKLRLNIPNAKFLKAAVDYYNFGDEHGAESDDGFRYGAEAHLIPGLRIALLYDNGEEELGGEVSYIHTIGEVQQSQTTNEQWTPDLFAAVSREHSQRIVSVNVDNSPSFSYRSVNLVRPITAIIGTVNIPAGYAPPSASVSVSAPAGFSVAAGGVVIATIAANSPLNIIATISINAAVSSYATSLIISLNVSRPSLSFISGVNNVVRPTTATIGTVNIPAGYALSVSVSAPAGFSVAATGGIVVFTAVSGLPPAMTTAIISIGADVAAYATALTISLNIGAVEIGRVANVQFTMFIPRTDGNWRVVTTSHKVMVTLPLAITIRPHVITLTRRNLESEFSGLGPAPARVHTSFTDWAGNANYAFPNITGGPYTITIVEGSEEIQSTLYAQADTPFDMPGFLPPSFPQMAGLELAKNRLAVVFIPPHWGFLRRKGFAIKPPPSVLL